MAKSTDGVYWGSYAEIDPTSPRFMANRAMDAVTLVENYYRTRLQEMSVNRFRYGNLPDKADERFIEMMMFQYGMILACKPNEIPEEIRGDAEVMFLQGAPLEGVDYQFNPLAFSYYGNDQFSGELRVADGNVVPIYSNRMRVPDSSIVWWYAKRLAEVETTIDINLKNARRTRVIATTEEQRMSVMNALMQIDQGQPGVFATTDLDVEGIKALDMGMQSSFLSDVPAAKNKLMNDCMTWLGIDNANQDKKERLVASEVDANGEQVSVNRAIALNERKLGIERVNKLFGTNITVGWASDYVNDRGQEESNGQHNNDPDGD